MKHFNILVVALATVMLLMLTGCGGGGGGGSSTPLNRSGSGYLGNGDTVLLGGQYAEFANFTAGVDGYVAVEMVKNGLSDPRVVVREGKCTTVQQWNSARTIGSDDDSGSGNNALFVFYATKGERFTVAFTSYSPGDYGGYLWAVYQSNGVTVAAPSAPDTVGDPVKEPIPDANNNQKE